MFHDENNSERRKEKALLMRTPNEARHRIAALLRLLLNVKGCVLGRSRCAQALGPERHISIVVDDY